MKNKLFSLLFSEHGFLFYYLRSTYTLSENHSQWSYLVKCVLEF